MFCNTTRIKSARTSRDEAASGLLNGASSLFWRENSALSSYSWAKFCVVAISCFFSPARTADLVYRRVANVAKSTERKRTKTSVPSSVICHRKLNLESGSLDGRASLLSTRPIIAIPVSEAPQTISLWVCSRRLDEVRAFAYARQVRCARCACHLRDKHEIRGTHSEKNYEPEYARGDSPHYLLPSMDGTLF